jgi:hypothetical protein
MSRFILRFRGPEPEAAKDVERIRALRQVKVLDDSSPRMLLVEAPEVEVKSLMASMSGWIMTPEQMVPLPDPRPKPRRARKK